MTAVYNAKGDEKETEVSIAADKLPSAARKYASLKGKIADAALITKANGEIEYEADVNHIDLLFDSQGNFIRQQKD